MATDKGQTNQKRKKIKSTKQQETTNRVAAADTTGTTYQNIFTMIIDHKKQKGTDLTGKLHVTSNRGNTYLFVLYD